ncbi:hypothetical protein VE02_10365 [Pseudogymnoascus sp. 03VT05]|nr:hypothetical protein VE02_10365 [Pseudogymnoascus sp. 03VT05]
MPVPVPSGALADSFRVLCVRCLRAISRGAAAHTCVWSLTSSKCSYCTSQHSPCVPVGFLLLFGFAFRPEFAALVAAKAATPLLDADVVAAAVKANRVLLLAAASVPKFRSEAERDLYEEARATWAALESGLAQIQSSLRCLRTEQESVLALLGELVAAVGKLPTAATPVAVLTRGGRRKEGDEEEEDRGVRAAYRA